MVNPPPNAPVRPGDGGGAAMAMLRELIHARGGIKIEHDPEAPAQYRVAIPRDPEEESDEEGEDYEGCGVGVSLEEAIADAHALTWHLR